MPIKKSQQSMAGGEVAPELYHRTDLAKYHVAMKTMRNSIAHKTGGGSNRPGFQFIDTVYDQNNITRLIPFEFNTDQTYILEFGATRLRVIKDGAYVLSGGVPYNILSPYAAADLALLKFTQSADVMTITHPSYQTRELSRTAHDNWSFSTVAYGPQTTAPSGGGGGCTVAHATSAISGISNGSPAVVTCAGHTMSDGDWCTINGVAGMVEVNNRSYRIRNLSSTTFELVGVSSLGYAAYISGGTVHQKARYMKYAIVAIDEETGEASLPYYLSLGPETFPQSSSVGNFVRWGAVAGAGRYDVYKEENDFYGYIGTAEGIEYFFDNNIAPDFSDTVQEAQDPFPGADDYPGCVTYHEQRRVFARTNNMRQTIWGTQTGNYYNMNTSLITKADDAYQFTIASRKVNEIRHLLSLSDLMVFTSGGVWKMNGGGASDAITPVNILVRNQSAIGCSDVPPITAGDYILFVEDGGDIINEIDYSFERDKYVANNRSILASHLFDDDQVREVAYSRKPDSIVWCVMESGKLLGMTYLPEHDVWAWHWHETDGEFESVASTREGTEDAVYVVVRRTIGGNTKRYTERLHTRVFSDVRDCFFVDSGLSLDNPIAISSILQTNPCSVTATAHGMSNGDYVDLSDIVGMTELNDKQFVVRNATANTFTLEDADGNDIDATGYTAYVSGGYAREAFTTISGLSHLEGKELAVLANGNVVTPSPTVVSGSITLTNPASRVHAGLPYISDMETLDIDTVDGKMNAKKIQVGEIKVKLKDSRGLFAGPDADHLTEWKQRGLAGEDYGEATALFTGLATMGVTSMWRDGGGVLLRQQYPLPLTVLSIIPKVSVGG